MEDYNEHINLYDNLISKKKFKLKILLPFSKSISQIIKSTFVSMVKSNSTILKIIAICIFVFFFVSLIESVGFFLFALILVLDHFIRRKYCLSKIKKIQKQIERLEKDKKSLLSMIGEIESIKKNLSFLEELALLVNDVEDLKYVKKYKENLNFIKDLLVNCKEILPSKKIVDINDELKRLNEITRKEIEITKIKIQKININNISILTKKIDIEYLKSKKEISNLIIEGANIDLQLNNLKNIQQNIFNFFEEDGSYSVYQDATKTFIEKDALILNTLYIDHYILNEKEINSFEEKYKKYFNMVSNLYDKKIEFKKVIDNQSVEEERKMAHSKTLLRNTSDISEQMKENHKKLLGLIENKFNESNKIKKQIIKNLEEANGDLKFFKSSMSSLEKTILEEQRNQKQFRLSYKEEAEERGVYLYKNE